MRLGIVGAENSHTIAIAKELNIDHLVKGFQVTHVWGETTEYARKAAEAGQIPHIVRKPEDMIGQIDCVMIDHRHGKHHVPAAMPFVKARLPIFMDKPLAVSLRQAGAFLDLCKRKKVPVTTMSAIPLQKGVKDVQRALRPLGTLRVVHLDGPGHYRSPYGGIWFYGIHQVDLMIELLGPNPQAVQMNVNKDCSTAVVNYRDDLTATITFTYPSIKTYSVKAYGAEGDWSGQVVQDANLFERSTKLFTTMFRTGKEPFSRQRMLAPLAVLEAMAQSLKTGRKVKITQV